MSVTVRNLVLGIVGLVLALWMGAGRWLFGLGGSLTWWYVPGITLTYVLLHWYAQHRMRLTERRGRAVGRAAYVTMVLSWVCAISFGFTVPDWVGDQLVSIVGFYGGVTWNEMAIALCNPFGIIAFALIIASAAFAAAAGRDRKPTEDELLDAAEAAGAGSSEADTVQMVDHPLK